MIEPPTQDPKKVKPIHLNRTFQVVKRGPAGYAQLELILSTTLNGLTFYASTFFDRFGHSGPIEAIEHELYDRLMVEIRRVLFAGTDL